MHTFRKSWYFLFLCKCGLRNWSSWRSKKSTPQNLKDFDKQQIRENNHIEILAPFAYFAVRCSTWNSLLTRDSKFKYFRLYGHNNRWQTGRFSDVTPIFLFFHLWSSCFSEVNCNFIATLSILFSFFVILIKNCIILKIISLLIKLTRHKPETGLNKFEAQRWYLWKIIHTYICIDR